MNLIHLIMFKFFGGASEVTVPAVILSTASLVGIFDPAVSLTGTFDPTEAVNGVFEPAETITGVIS